MTSRMPNVYIHYFGNESSNSLLESYGIENFSKEKTNSLKSKVCPNCNEPNKPESRFCIKCRMVLNYDAYSETLEEQTKREDQIKTLEKKYENDLKQMKEDIENKLQLIMSKIDISKV
jgi:hypothetical protein